MRQVPVHDRMRVARSRIDSVMNPWSKDLTISRRDLNRASLSLLAAAAAKALGAAAGVTNEAHTVGRRKIIQQVLPGDPPREIILVEVSYPPGTGSPAHLHANGVMAFVVAGTIISRLGESPEETFQAGEAWWEPPGTVHRVSRNPSATAPASLLAIYIAPAGATAEELMKPI
jgi:quercetin dioxygenase-like cupin family protein